MFFGWIGYGLGCKTALSRANGSHVIPILREIETQDSSGGRTQAQDNPLLPASSVAGNFLRLVSGLPRVPSNQQEDV